eukprot:1083432_1
MILTRSTNAKTVVKPVRVTMSVAVATDTIFLNVKLIFIPSSSTTNGGANMYFVQPFFILICPSIRFKSEHIHTYRYDVVSAAIVHYFHSIPLACWITLSTLVMYERGDDGLILSEIMIMDDVIVLMNTLYCITSI